jgi:hypothetical protein
MVMVSSVGTKGVSDVRSMVPEGWLAMDDAEKGKGLVSRVENRNPRAEIHHMQRTKSRAGFFFVGCPLPGFLFSDPFFLNYLFFMCVMKKGGVPAPREPSTNVSGRATENFPLQQPETFQLTLPWSLKPRKSQCAIGTSGSSPV